MKIALLPNLTREPAKETTLEICKWLKEYGAEYACTDDDFPEFSGTLLKRHMEFSKLISWCDAVITVGGDGSMLMAAKKTVDFLKPILCINAGRLAFMAGLERDELHLLKALIDGTYYHDKRMLIEASLIRDGKSISKYHCINDVVLSRPQQMKIADINVECDGRHVNTYRADGIIIATPTGSSAYSLSAGGPILNPSIEAIVVSPICPQSLFARSIVFSSDNKVDIYCAPESRNSDLILSCDGEFCETIHKGDIISISKSDKYVDFIRIKEENFLEILNNKLAGRNEVKSCERP